MKKLNLSFEKFVMLVYSFNEIKTTYGPIYYESNVISAATPLSQLRRHGSHSTGRLISLSQSKLQHSIVVQNWSTCLEVVVASRKLNHMQLA